MDSRTLRIEVSGPNRSGKGLLIAFLAHHLQAAGIPLMIQGATTHNKSKLEKLDPDLLAKLEAKNITVVFTEMQTASLPSESSSSLDQVSLQDSPVLSEVSG